MRYNTVRLFKTEREAESFANKMNTESWGWMKDCDTDEITGWYVEYNDPNWRAM